MLLALCVAGRAFALSPEALQTMVIVAGDQGSGSGFVMKMGDKLYVITNSHVIRGNKNVNFKNLSNQELTVGPLEIADHADLVRAEITGQLPFLTMAQNAEKSLQIGDDVVVAGNSEGEGVVREIPGKVTGIGPDRIEVDAGFVPGNSGSPILLKSTGQVIGVATYMKIPRSLRGSTKSELSLNEVRRFGYRPDTVTNWVHPTTPDRIMKEGMKLAELEQTMAVVVAILNGGTSALSRFGSSGYINKERIAANPGLAKLAAAVDEFTSAVATTKDPAQGKQNVIKLFDAIKTATVEDIRGYKEEFFTGYFAQQFGDLLKERRKLYEALDQMVTMAAKNPQLLSGPVSAGSAPPVDVSKLNFQLKEEVYTASDQQKAHRVTYPVEQKPDNLENIFWVDEMTGGVIRAVQMHTNAFSFFSNSAGFHKVRVEYRNAGMIRRVSNEVELDLSGPGSSPVVSSTVPVVPEVSGPPLGTGFTNSMGMKFVAVPGTGIYMCVHDTRRKDYAAYARENPSTDGHWKNATKYRVPVGDGEDHPVVMVSWDDAVAFCEWLSKKEGMTYPAASDQEWSYAAGIGGRESKGVPPKALGEKIQNEYPWGTEWPPPRVPAILRISTTRKNFPRRNASMVTRMASPRPHGDEFHPQQAGHL